MSIKKIIIAWLIISVNYAWAFAYAEVSCSSDDVFAANSCTQCFDWWNKEAWNDLWFLSDTWVNQTGDDILLYKEEQEMPTLINLGWENTSWKKQPNDIGFWEYTDELNDLYSDLEEWYILSNGWSVTWIKSKLGYTYNLAKNTALEWSNIGMLVFPLITRKIIDGELSLDWDTLKECVLYKSWKEWTKTKTEVVPTQKLPETGPSEYILLLILAMILGFSTIKILNRR